MIKRDIVEYRVFAAINGVIAECQKQLGIEDGSISLGMVNTLDAVQEMMTSTILKVLGEQMEAKK